MPQWLVKRRLCFEQLEARNLLATFQGLGNLAGGGFNSVPYGVSADGSTIVGQSGREAFRWTSGGMVSLGDLPGGGFNSIAYGVSADGSTIVGEGSSANGREAFRWTSAGMVPLGDLPGGLFSSHARGVSANGSTIVGQGTSANFPEAFRWTSGGMAPLGGATTASGVSADGSTIVGWRSTANNRNEAYRWRSGGMVPLGDLPGGDFESFAHGVSADGSTIVVQGVSVNVSKAFRWTESDGMVPLGDLPGGFFDSVACGVSADGSTIVGRSESVNGYEAFLWTESDGMKSVRELLVQAGVDTTGWLLSEATAVSADGRVIVGTGTNPSFQAEAWRAVLDPAADIADIVVSSVAWNSTIGGVDIGYTVDGTFLTTNTSIDVYWATGTTLADRIGTTPVYSYQVDTVAEKSVGLHSAINIPGSALRGAPLETTHILVVADPTNIYTPSTPPNTRAISDASLEYRGITANSAYVSPHSTQVVKGLLRFAGEDSAVITSTARTPPDQARIMYDKLEKGKGRGYKLPGQQVIAVYDTLKAQGKLRSEIEAAMVAKMYQVGLANVSRHLANLATENVIDIDPSSIKNQSLFAKGARAAKVDGRLNEFLEPPKDEDVFHFQIPQPTTMPSSGAVNSSFEVHAEMGSVSNGHALFTFEGIAGTSITITVLVTAVFPGTTYTDDDTELFLFDSSGRLLASNDDPPPEDTLLQSLISNFSIPETGTYTVAVTTFDNDPLFDEGGHLIGWEDDGESSVSFDIKATAFLPGDYNQNGTVDAGDYVVWRLTVGSTDQLTADGNFDSVVDQFDYEVWRSNFGKTFGTAGGSMTLTALATGRVEFSESQHFSMLRFSADEFAVAQASSISRAGLANGFRSIADFPNRSRPVGAAGLPTTAARQNDASLVAWLAGHGRAREKDSEHIAQKSSADVQGNEFLETVVEAWHAAFESLGLALTEFV